MSPKEFYIVSEGIFRLGNVTGSRLSCSGIVNLSVMSKNGLGYE